MEPSQKRTAITDVIFSSEVYRDFLKCCSLFSDNENFFIDGKIRKNQIWSYPDLVQHFVKNEANRAIVELVFTTICNYEKKRPGSGLSFLKIAKNNFSYSASAKTRASSSVIINSIQKNLDCEFTKDVLQQIKRYGNPQLSVSVQRMPIEKPILKFVSTPSVKLRVAPGFLPRSTKHNNCHFFMVNGAVSKSSEITRLLNESFENKHKSYFLVCKSFNEEVLNTLRQNYDRNITNVIPVEFGFDLDSVNSLADLKSIIGGLPFSSELGDLLSSADFSRMGFSDQVIIESQVFIIKPSQNNTDHIDRLSKKIQESNAEKRKLLSKRMIRLKGNSCNIHLPKHSSFNSIEINIRHAALLINNMSKHGVVEIKTSKNKFYIPETSYTIMPELKERIQDLLKTKIYLPRREK